MAAVQRETCERCQECGFAMHLKAGVCHRLLLTGYRQPETARRAVPYVRRQRYGPGNRLWGPARADPGGGDGDCPCTRPDAHQTGPRAPVSVHRPLRHVHAGYCADGRRAPQPPAELDIVLLQPPESCTDSSRYRRQFQTDFRVRRQCVLTWLRFLKANHPETTHVGDLRRPCCGSPGRRGRVLLGGTRYGPCSRPDRAR